MKRVGDDIIYEGPRELMKAYGLESTVQARYWCQHGMIPVYRVGQTYCSTQRLLEIWRKDQDLQALTNYREAERKRGRVVEAA